MVLWKRKAPAVPNQRDPPQRRSWPGYRHREPGMLFPRRDARGRLIRQDCVTAPRRSLHGPLNRADRLPFGGAVTFKNGSNETGEREG